MVAGPPNLVALIDVERRTLIRSGRVDIAGGDLLTVFPIQLWGRTPVTVSTGGDIVGFGTSLAAIARSAECRHIAAKGALGEPRGRMALTRHPFGTFMAQGLVSKGEIVV